jgi:hypothetical protein
MEIKGTVKVIMDEQVISDKFRKREFVVIDDSTQYPQEIIIQTSNDKVSLLDGLKSGQFVKVAINLRGRMWTNPKDGQERYFNTIEAWKVDFIEEEVKQDQQPAEGDDDLPF